VGGIGLGSIHPEKVCNQKSIQGPATKWSPKQVLEGTATDGMGKK
jgi:hypothetical protein